MLTGRLLAAGSGNGELAREIPPLLHDALSTLDADLGDRFVGWVPSPNGPKTRRYRRRLELLAEAVEPDTLQVVIRWLASAHRGSTATRRGYCDDLLAVWAPLARELGHQQWAFGQLTTAHLEMWRLRMSERGIAPRTINRYVATLSSLYSYAAGVLDPPPRNPVTEDVRPRIDQADASTATPILEKEEVAKVAAQASRLADLVLIVLLYVLAGRVTEICRADANDLRIQGRRTFLRVRRKGGEVRDLEIPHFLADLLELYLDGRTEGPLLRNSQGGRLDRHGALWISKSLGRAAGVLNGHATADGVDGRDLTPHVWRASRITHMLDALYQQSGEQGVMAGLAQVMVFANHKSPQTTLRYWVRRSQADRNAELAHSGEQVLANVLQQWLNQTNDAHSAAHLFASSPAPTAPTPGPRQHPD
ncbi:tyrosine-type recombinase/integrase [Actinomadura yumaensis]|uniref:Tyrosine-type recombinase/integrase n=1 Tax=Actinomadura yumaensis TaxID=111807 RepID=A0ABW2CHN7_9ACTN